ncbi:MAG: Protein GrpE, partial [Rhodoglobus sp.]|nr:Protein GrpE [Rhodoglobus sp.]
MADKESNEEPVEPIDETESAASEAGVSDDGAPASADESVEEDLSEADQALLDQAATDLVAEMRTDMLRAQAELVNFR